MLNEVFQVPEDSGRGLWEFKMITQRTCQTEKSCLSTRRLCYYSLVFNF